MKYELKAFARLKEVFNFWHKSAEFYFDPEEFRMNLNACIQAIRNVTFLLQSQKSEIEGFDSWYGEWQDAMKSDPIMKWCVFARNKVVKQGDLKKRSIAKVEIIKSYLEPVSRTLIVDPFLGTEQIAKMIIDDSLSESFKKTGFLKVERIWSVEKLNNVEVLEALAHAFIVLSSLIEDASVQKGVKHSYPSYKKRESFVCESSLIDSVRNIFPPCMKKFSEYRIITIKLANKERFEFEDSTMEVTKEDVLEIADRYDLDSYVKNVNHGKDTLKDMVEYYLEIGKRVLEVDGCHLLTITLIDKNNKPNIIQGRFYELEDKFLFWNNIAEKVKNENIVKVLVVGEVWQAIFDEGMKVTNATEAPHRTEALQVVGASSDGQEIQITIPFTKDKNTGKVVFGDKCMLENVNMGFLMPVKRVWNGE